jgi:hypothetical protein
MLVQPDPDVINRWSDAAPFWEKHREIIRQMFAPVGRRRLWTLRCEMSETLSKKVAFKGPVSRSEASGARSFSCVFNRFWADFPG